MIICRSQNPHKIKLLKHIDGYEVEFNDNTFHFKESEIRYAPDVAYLRYADGIGMYLAQATETGESRSGLAYSYFRNGQSFSNNSTDLVVAFYIDDDKSMSVYVNGSLENFDEFDNVVDAEIKNPLAAFASNIPNANKFVQRIRAKQKLLRQINEMDVLAAIEAQLDLLTLLVLSQYSDENLQNAIEGCMVTEIHDKATLVSTIKKQKQYLRNLQREYFETRGTAINGKPTAA